MKKIIIGLVAVLIAAFCGVMIYIPAPDSDYPTAYTVDEYQSHIQKNSDLIIEKLEAIDKPTLRETMIEYEKEAMTIAFYPTALDTINEAESRFLETDQLIFFRDWRVKRFLNKYYGDACEYQRSFEEASYAAVKEGELADEYYAEPYIYKDGSVIRFGADLMSIAYAD